MKALLILVIFIPFVLSAGILRSEHPGTDTRLTGYSELAFGKDFGTPLFMGWGGLRMTSDVIALRYSHVATGKGDWRYQMQIAGGGDVERTDKSVSIPGWGGTLYDYPGFMTDWGKPVFYLCNIGAGVNHYTNMGWRQAVYHTKVGNTMYTYTVNGGANDSIARFVSLSGALAVEGSLTHYAKVRKYLPSFSPDFTEKFSLEDMSPFTFRRNMSWDHNFSFYGALGCGAFIGPRISQQAIWSDTGAYSFKTLADGYVFDPYLKAGVGAGFSFLLPVETRWEYRYYWTGKSQLRAWFGVNFRSLNFSQRRSGGEG